MLKDVNRFNQSNNYGSGEAQIDAEYSALKMAQSIVGTGDMGYLIPVFWRNLAPSQKITNIQEIGMQFNPFVSNLMHEITGELHSFAVPMRLMMAPGEWEKFIMGGADGLDETPHPNLSIKALFNASTKVPKTLRGTIADYLGWPINHDTTLEEADCRKPTAFVHRAINKYYNDQIRLPDIEPDLIDQDNNELLKANYDYDYFTRARVYQQRGVVPSIPISDELSQLEHDITSDVHTTEVSWSGPNTGAGSFAMLGNTSTNDPQNQNTKDVLDNNTTTTTSNLAIAAHDLETLGMNLNDWWIGNSMMRVQTNNAKIQPRYKNWLKIRFGIPLQDARLDQAEYIGTNTFKITTEGVVQTGIDASGESGVGTITGQALGKGQGMRMEYEAQEHTMVVTMMVIKPKAVYEGGLDKMFQKENRWDYILPEMSNIPDIPVIQNELKYTGITDDDNTIFGYQSQYEPYRTMFNQVVGRVRPSESGNLVSYTLARWWDTATPLLNKAFIGVDADKDRIMQYTDEPTFVYFLRNEVQTAIPIPAQTSPGDPKLS